MHGYSTHSLQHRFVIWKEQTATSCRGRDRYRPGCDTCLIPVSFPLHSDNWPRSMRITVQSKHCRHIRPRAIPQPRFFPSAQTDHLRYHINAPSQSLSKLAIHRRYSIRGLRIHGASYLSVRWVDANVNPPSISYHPVVSSCSACEPSHGSPLYCIFQTCYVSLF